MRGSRSSRRRTRTSRRIAGSTSSRIQKAIDAAEKGRRLRGASTISQQVAKNVFLWSGRSFVRKGLEAYFTVLIELTWSKRRILEVYLNVAEMGDGVFGVEAASQRFFKKPAAKMGPSEAALLAAVLPNPIRFRVNRPSAYVEERRAWILGADGPVGGRGAVQGMVRITNERRTLQTAGVYDLASRRVTHATGCRIGATSSAARFARRRESDHPRGARLRACAPGRR